MCANINKDYLPYMGIAILCNFQHFVFSGGRMVANGPMEKKPDMSAS